MGATLLVRVGEEVFTFESPPGDPFTLETAVPKGYADAARAAFSAAHPLPPRLRARIAAEARWFQALPAAERWREIFALRHWAARLARSSSRGDAIRRLEDLEETRWQAIQKDLFARHGG